MDLTEKPIKQEYIYKGKILNIRVDDALLPDGGSAKREVVEHNGGVMIAPLDDDYNLYFVEQFRYPYMEIVTELPAGKLEKGEEALSAGMRELKEETGATADNITSLGKLYPSPGYTSEIIYLYLARGLSFGEQELDFDEFLEIKKIHLDKAVKMVMDGEIPDSKTQVAILKIKLLKDEGLI